MQCYPDGDYLDHTLSAEIQHTGAGTSGYCVPLEHKKYYIQGALGVKVFTDHTTCQQMRMSKGLPNINLKSSTNWEKISIVPFKTKSREIRDSKIQQEFEK